MESLSVALDLVGSSSWQFRFSFFKKAHMSMPTFEPHIMVRREKECAVTRKIHVGNISAYDCLMVC